MYLGTQEPRPVFQPRRAPPEATARRQKVRRWCACSSSSPSSVRVWGDSPHLRRFLAAQQIAPVIAVAAALVAGRRQKLVAQ